MSLDTAEAEQEPAPIGEAKQPSAETQQAAHVPANLPSTQSLDKADNPAGEQGLSSSGLPAESIAEKPHSNLEHRTTDAHPSGRSAEPTAAPALLQKPDPAAKPAGIGNAVAMNGSESFVQAPEPAAAATDHQEEDMSRPAAGLGMHEPLEVAQEEPMDIVGGTPIQGPSAVADQQHAAQADNTERVDAPSHLGAAEATTAAEAEHKGNLASIEPMQAQLPEERKAETLAERKTNELPDVGPDRQAAQPDGDQGKCLAGAGVADASAKEGSTGNEAASARKDTAEASLEHRGLQAGAPQSSGLPHPSIPDHTSLMSQRLAASQLQYLDLPSLQALLANNGLMNPTQPGLPYAQYNLPPGSGRNASGSTPSQSFVPDPASSGAPPIQQYQPGVFHPVTTLSSSILPQSQSLNPQLSPHSGFQFPTAQPLDPANPGSTGTGSFLFQKMRHTGGLAEILAKVGQPVQQSQADQPREPEAAVQFSEAPPAKPTQFSSAQPSDGNVVAAELGALGRRRALQGTDAQKAGSKPASLLREAQQAPLDRKASGDAEKTDEAQDAAMLQSAVRRKADERAQGFESTQAAPAATDGTREPNPIPEVAYPGGVDSEAETVKSAEVSCLPLVVPNQTMILLLNLLQ